ncbi:MAG: hypothetical protein COA52_00005, partial [Hyphomicrobiales bacterium]
MVNALKSGNLETNMAKTENGALTHATSGNACVDMFFKLGAMRGADVSRIQSTFHKAFMENPELATRIALWVRDIDKGAGERKIFRDILLWLETNEIVLCEKVVEHVIKTPKLIRWDDILIFKTAFMKDIAYNAIEEALKAKDSLCAKWCPRKGLIAVELRKHMGLTPKQYRKLIVGLTNVIETKMCNNEWEAIEPSKIPSLASARYRTALFRHIPDVMENYANKVEKGEAKINAGAVYPYDVLKPLMNYSYYHSSNCTASEVKIAQAQWNALPDFIGDNSILPVIDVSGSMGSTIAGNLTCMDISLSLGLYCATKQSGPFENLVVTFSNKPKFIQLKKSNISENLKIMRQMDWGMNTNIQATFDALLERSKRFEVTQDDMPKYILIISDMEFDSCSERLTNFQNIKSKFKKAGYIMPNLVFWNVQARGDAETVPISETSKIQPTNPYGQSKAMIEQVLNDLAASDPLWSLGVLRYFNPVGAHKSGEIGEDPQGTPDNLFPYVAQVAVGRRDRLQVFGDDYDTPDGTGVRDYIHVVDLAIGHVQALEHCLSASGVFTVNLGTGNGNSVLEMIHAFEKTSGKPVPYEIVDRRP